MTSDASGNGANAGAGRNSLLLFLALLAAALLAHRPALNGARFASTASPMQLLGWKVAICVGVALGGGLVARAVRRSGAGAGGAFGAALLFVAATASRSLLWSASGSWILGATLLFLFVMDRWLVTKRTAWTAVVAAAATSAALLLFVERADRASLAALVGESLRRALGIFSSAPLLAADPRRLIPLAFLLPLLGALAWLVGRALRRAALLPGLALLAAQVAFVRPHDFVRDALERALPNGAAASGLSALTGDPAALEQAVLANADGAPRLPAELEQELGLQAATMRERADDPQGALAWIERWLATRSVGDSITPPPAPLPEVHAHRLALLVELRGPDAAAAALHAELPAFGDDRRYVAGAASALIDALQRSARDPKFVAVVLPLVERLLVKADADPGSASADELECLALLRVGQARYIDAVKLAELAIRKEPKRARPHVVLARIYLGRGEREAGLREVAVARTLDPADPAAKLLEGRLLCASGDFAEKGVERMLASLAAAPQRAGVREEIDEGLFAATTALLGRDQADLANRLLARTIDAVGRRAALVHALGKVAVHQRRFDDGAELLAEALAAAPQREGLTVDLAEALRDAGYGRLLAGDRPGAVDRFERALAVAPADFDTTGMRSVIQSSREQRDPPDPKGELDVAAARIAFDAATRLYATGDKEGAKRALQRSIELLPLNPLAHLNLGRVELDLGHPKEAEGHLRTAIAIGAARAIDVEEAYPYLVRALAEQAGEKSPEASTKKVRTIVDEYLAHYPQGRYRDELSKLR